MVRAKFLSHFRKLPDYSLVILFGLLSDVFSLIQFRLPNNENVYSDLREIPLLVGIMYLRNPLLIALCCIWSPMTYFIGVPYFPTVVMHLVPLLVIAWMYKTLIPEQTDQTSVWIKWLLIVLVYYFGLLFPSSVFTYRIFELDKGHGFSIAYFSLVKTSLYEITATALTTVLYVIQFEMTKSLAYANQNLERIVDARTQELVNANKHLQAVNEELTSTNEKVKSLNDNLEKLVAERTAKVNEQLRQLSKYAHMNSHEVRAPLARILGLIHLIKEEEDKQEIKNLIEKLTVASEDLDIIIKKMNRLLEEEIN